MKILRRIDLGFDRCTDRVGDFVLHRKHVGERPVVALRPKMTASGDVLSCTVMRTRSPLFRTLPSTT